MSSPSNNPYYQPPNNPYQGPSPGPTQPTQSGGTPGKVLAPAISLIVCGVLDGLWGALRIVGGALMGPDPAPPDIPPDAPPLLKDFLEQAGNTSPAFEIGMGVLMIALAAAIVVGGVMMMKRQAWGMAVAGSIICMLPCVTCLGCCGVGEGVGIWAVIILMQVEVKAMFR